jgi:hypothetical protein
MMFLDGSFFFFGKQQQGRVRPTSHVRIIYKNQTSVVVVGEKVSLVVCCCKGWLAPPVCCIYVMMQLYFFLSPLPILSLWYILLHFVALPVCLYIYRRQKTTQNKMEPPRKFCVCFVFGLLDSFIDFFWCGS